MHLAPRGDSHSMGDSDLKGTFSYLARELGKRKLAFLCTREREGPDSITPLLKREFGGLMIANEGFTQESGEAAIARGDADAVAYGKLIISNPDLVERFRTGAPLNEWDMKTFYTHDAARLHRLPRARTHQPHGVESIEPADLAPVRGQGAQIAVGGDELICAGDLAARNRRARPRAALQRLRRNRRAFLRLERTHRVNQRARRASPWLLRARASGPAAPPMFEYRSAAGATRHRDVAATCRSMCTVRRATRHRMAL